MKKLSTIQFNYLTGPKQATFNEPLHILCRLQWKRLRAWKKRSLRADVVKMGRIRPQAYSSYSPAFHGLLNDWSQHKNKPAVLWIVTSYRIPGRRTMIPSLAARIFVHSTYHGNDEHLPDELRRYVVRWGNSEKGFKPEFCMIAEADPDNSRFFPANDMSGCLGKLTYGNKDGTLTRYSPRRVIKVHPQSIHIIEKYAEELARRTVFISYKHSDFAGKDKKNIPPWTVKELVGALINEKWFFIISSG
jgi:hypothetical protein